MANTNNPGEKRHRPKDNGVQMPFSEPAFVEKWQEWLTYRKERRLPQYVPTGLKRTLSRLVSLSNGDWQTAILIIDQSLSNNWQGLFSIKPDSNAAHPQANTAVGREIEFDKL